MTEPMEVAAPHLLALEAREASLKARIQELEGALRKIANPIGYFQEYAKQEGRQIDGHMAIQISNDPGWLKSEAAKALQPKEIAK